MKNTAGCINCHKKKANNTENIRACLSIECITPLRDCGNMADSIREPSSGGIGTKLKVASTKFVKTIISRAKIAGFGKFTAKNLIDRVKFNLRNIVRNTWTKGHVLIKK